MGDVVSVGGSLVPVGGHNLLEPAALGLPRARWPEQSLHQCGYRRQAATKCSRLCPHLRRLFRRSASIDREAFARAQFLLKRSSFAGAAHGN